MNKRFNWKNTVQVLLAAVIFFPLVTMGESGSTANGNGTFHKGWKKRNTPRKPVWGPSLCGHSAIPVKRNNRKSRTRRSEEKINDKSIPDKQKSKRGGNSAYFDSESEKIYIRELQKIHSLQIALLEGKDKLTLEEKEEKEKAIRSIYYKIADLIKKSDDFPFSDQMWNMNAVLDQIRENTVVSKFSMQGKSDRQLLKEIQREQFKRYRETVSSQIWGKTKSE